MIFEPPGWGLGDEVVSAVAASLVWSNGKYGTGMYYLLSSVLSLQFTGLLGPGFCNIF